MKNIEDLKKRLWSRMRNYTDDKKLLRRYMNDLNLLQAEYDKSIKEMIKDEIEWLDYILREINIDLTIEKLIHIRIIKLKELLSKIGDVQQSQEKRNEK